MALYDSAYLLQECQDLAGRPSNDPDMTPAKWYRLLTTAQQHWFAAIVTFCPEALVGAPVLMETPDGGYTYRIPLAEGESVVPFGLAEVRARRNGELLRLGPEWASGTDLVPEFDLLRVPNGRTRSFGDGPYIRYAALPSEITADAAPTLPQFARRLLAPHACWLWASRPPNPTDPDYFRGIEQRYWMGDPQMPGDNGIMGALAFQFLGQDGEEGGEDSAWWYSADLG